MEPDDAVSLADGLLRLRKDTELRAALGRQGAEGKCANTTQSRK